MGVDMTAVAEKREGGVWTEIPQLYPFDWRSYGLYGFLANIRNYSAIPPISEPRGYPDGSTMTDEDDDYYFGASWLSVEELMSFDYAQTFEDRRVTRQVAPNQWDGGCTAEPGGGEVITFREFLGAGYFEELARLQTAGAERIVFRFVA